MAIDISKSVRDRIENRVMFGGSDTTPAAFHVVGMFAIANALETGLVAIAKAIAKPDANTDRHVAFPDKD
jgi:hypothetical protein